MFLRPGLVSAIVLGFGAFAFGFGPPGPGSHGGPGKGGPGFNPGVKGQRNIVWNPEIVVAWGAAGPVPIAPTLIVLSPGIAPAPVVTAPPNRWFEMPAQPPFPLGADVPAQTVLPARPRRIDVGRSAELVEIGDRLFRAKNWKRAEERYVQAIRANPGSAVPLVRLAQIELARGLWTKAADRVREAFVAEPRWLATARDIRGLYAEPADFEAAVAALETRVQAHPEDRDAWLVLGTELYLSGEIRRASDVFQRLNDRQPDPALALFLDAVRPRR